MYRGRSGGVFGGSSKSELESKRITDSFDKRLEKSSPSSSKAVTMASGSGSKERERFGAAKGQFDLRDPRDGVANGHGKNKLSEG